MPQFDIIRHGDALLALKPEWDDLWLRSPHASYYQSAAYAIHSWQHVAEPNGCRLFCVSARSEGRLRLVWPLKIHRKGLWRIVEPLASNAAEDTDVLAEDGAAGSACVGEALAIVRDRSGVDVIDLPYVSAGTELGTQVRHALGAGHPNLNPFLTWQRGESFEAYRESLSRSTRKVVDKKHRRLSGMGALRFEVVRGEDRIVEATRTLLRYKRVWSRKLAETGAYVHAPHFERFLTAITLASTDERQGMRLFVLSLDGVALAVQSAAVGHRVDWLAAAYHPDHHQLSPGIVLNEYCLRWAHARGLAVMMGPGQQANKEFWCRRQVYRSASYKVPASPWGAAAFRAMALRRAVGTLRRHGLGGVLVGAARASDAHASDAHAVPDLDPVRPPQGSSL